LSFSLISKLFEPACFFAGHTSVTRHVANFGFGSLGTRLLPQVQEQTPRLYHQLVEGLLF
jgi:hypothetical protein